MTDKPLFVAFLWHMHQPYYKHPFTGLYHLPWVRLHGTKDYRDMVDILLDFPMIRQTFNVTPSLIEQIIDYTEHGAKDRFLIVSMKKADDLDADDRAFILEHFFLANWDHMIKPFPRYYELLIKRGTHLVSSEVKRMTTYFSVRDFLDLQVLFNLCWFDPMFRASDPFLKSLVEKGRDFTEDEKTLLIEKQREILKTIIPRYREMASAGSIELSVSPFYHPILPLLYDTNIAKVALPDIRLPKKRFAHPEDARQQIKMGIEFFERIFGYRPAGMWPSEGSVSEDVVKLIAEEGIRWIATDEDILARSLGTALRDGSRNVLDFGALYSPHRYHDVAIFFRDHTLSDLIGFDYMKWDPQRAAEDFVSRLLEIRRSVPEDRPHVVSIILDGENAWEHYRNDGHDFLRALYTRLAGEERLRTVTISEYLNAHDGGRPLSRLHPGSWIYGNFAIWIGHEEDNMAWDYLTETREDLQKAQDLDPTRDLSAAWKALYIAEGSDWNWWYGDEHTTENQEEFDELFRSHLMNVYREIGKEIPAHLFRPVLREDRSVIPTVFIRGFIEPRIDGVVTSYYEWYHAAYLETRKTGGSMHKSESLLTALYYGFNRECLFVRLDGSTPFRELIGDMELVFDIIAPRMRRIAVSFKPDLRAALFEKRDGIWSVLQDIDDLAVDDIFEMKIPFRLVEAKERDEIIFSVVLLREGEEIERCPSRGYIAVTVPTPDFEAMMWY